MVGNNAQMSSNWCYWMQNHEHNTLNEGLWCCWAQMKWNNDRRLLETVLTVPTINISKFDICVLNVQCLCNICVMCECAIPYNWCRSLLWRKAWNQVDKITRSLMKIYRNRIVWTTNILLTKVRNYTHTVEN